jgi:teichuronic acid biosynthesis glycosyltransferase TuaG
VNDSTVAAAALTQPSAFVDTLVSIITPAYRAAAHIGETIESVQAQDYAEWEMLIVDDCSPDNTAEVVARYAAADTRVRLIRQSRNGGPAAARSAALAHARGRWVAFLDSDDLWLPDKLSAQLAFHRGSDAVLTFTSFRRINAAGDKTGRLIHIRPRLDYLALLKNTAIATSTVIVDRRISGTIKMKPTYYDDYACWLELLRPGRIALGLDRDLMRYRVLGKSVSRNKLKSASHVWRTYREVERLGLLRSMWSFANYAGRGVLKYWRF